jgi:hypothetical protein
MINRTANTSQRLNKRSQPPTDIGTNTRIAYGLGCHRKVANQAAAGRPTATNPTRSHIIAAAAFKPFYEWIKAKFSTAVKAPLRRRNDISGAVPIAQAKIGVSRNHRIVESMFLGQKCRQFDS